MTDSQLRFLGERSLDNASVLSKDNDDEKSQEGLAALHKISSADSESKMRVLQEHTGLADLQIARLAAKGVTYSINSQEKDEVVSDYYLKVIQNSALPEEIRREAAQELDFQESGFRHTLDWDLKRVKQRLFEKKGNPSFRELAKKYHGLEEKAAGDPKLKLLLALVEKEAAFSYSRGNTNADLLIACEKRQAWAMLAYVYRQS